MRNKISNIIKKIRKSYFLYIFMLKVEGNCSTLFIMIINNFIIVYKYNDIGGIRDE